MLSEPEDGVVAGASTFEVVSGDVVVVDASTTVDVAESGGAVAAQLQTAVPAASMAAAETAHSGAFLMMQGMTKLAISVFFGPHWQAKSVFAHPCALAAETIQDALNQVSKHQLSSKVRLTAQDGIALVKV